MAASGSAGVQVEDSFNSRTSLGLARSSGPMSSMLNTAIMRLLEEN